jgi:hypothetical protein
MEWLGWVRIFLSPTLLCGIIAYCIFVNFPGLAGILAAVFVASCGVIIGSYWATKEYKGRGTIQFVSRVMATPELDKKDPPAVDPIEKA